MKEQSHHATIQAVKEWQTFLNNLRLENISLKNRLSEAISHDVSTAFVEQAEHFQQRFVEKDQVMDLLRHDINTILQDTAPVAVTEADQRQYRMLEKDMQRLRDEFNQMKRSFATFLSLDKQT